MLSDLGVSNSWKWEDVNRVILDEERTKVLKTMAERKQAFQDYVKQLRNAEKEELHERKQQARQNFIELLREQNGKEGGQRLGYLSKYYLVSKRLQTDPRFKAIEERDREEVFQDFIDKLGEQERDTKRATAQKRVEQLIHEYEIDEGVSIDTRWSDMVEVIEAKKSTIPVYAEADAIDKLAAFEEYVKDLERDDFQTKKQDRRRRERKNREKFAALMEALFKARLAHQRTKWRELVTGIKQKFWPQGTNQALLKIAQEGLVRQPAYLDLIGQSGTTPCEYFEEHVRKERDQLKLHKSAFKGLVKQHGIRLGSDVTQDNFSDVFNVH